MLEHARDSVDRAHIRACIQLSVPWSLTHSHWAGSHSNKLKSKQSPTTLNDRRAMCARSKQLSSPEPIEHQMLDRRCALLRCKRTFAVLLALLPAPDKLLPVGVRVLAWTVRQAASVLADVNAVVWVPQSAHVKGSIPVNRPTRVQASQTQSGSTKSSSVLNNLHYLYLNPLGCRARHPAIQHAKGRRTRSNVQTEPVRALRSKRAHHNPKSCNMKTQTLPNTTRCAL